jgi:PKD repeat protein
MRLEDPSPKDSDRMSEKASHWWPYLLVVALSAMFLLWRCSMPVAPAVSPTPTAGPVATVTPLRAEVVGSPTATPPSTVTAAVATAAPTVTAYILVPTLPATVTSTATATPEPTVTPNKPAAPAPVQLPRIR